MHTRLGSVPGVVNSYQNVWNVLGLHDEELVIADDRFEELQRHGCVLIPTHPTGNQLGLNDNM